MFIGINVLHERIDGLVADAIAERIFPGCVVLAWCDGTLLHQGAYGTTMYDDPGSRPVELGTIYDIASLTKLFTATAALALFDAGRLDLEAEVTHFLPGLRARGVTIQHLLTHSSGLDLRLSVLCQSGAAGIWSAIAAAEPLRPPGSFCAYTNINSLLLGEVVAVAFDGSLDAAIRTLVLDPLGMGETGFNPPVALRPRIAPTEWDDAWRGGLVQGSVHDESAHALGGVAGHAGLFSSAGDLLRFARGWIESGRLLREATIAAAWRDYTAGMGTATGHTLHSGLGWMLDRNSFMGYAPRGIVGHTGFTGPVVVVAPARRLVLIMLSNRTYPRRTPPPYRHHGVTAAILATLLEAVE